MTVVRTRFAPSPTGALHVGNARMAVVNWLFTRAQSGSFILRIEDTDAERNVAGSEAGICADLSWLGLQWDEGPYRQSERASLYRQAAARLHESGHAYACFCTDEELEEARRTALERGEQPHYSGRCRALPAAEVRARQEAGAPYALRFRVPADREVLVEEAARGTVRVHSSELSDFIILRSDGLPTYNFAVVVDDIDMAISHVIRGSGHLSNTPRQVLLYEAFGKQPPKFAHLGTVLGPDRQKLSKRHGATSIAEYRAQGYHPDALVNYLALLSWSSPSGEEVLSREQLIAQLTLERVGVADVMFDGAKLRFLSAKHIERMPLPELVAAVKPFLDHDRYPLDDGALEIAVAAIRTHLHTFAEINEQLAPFFPAAEGARTDSPVVQEAAALLSECEWTQDGLSAALKEVSAASGAKGRALYEPLRMALTGEQHGPPFIALLQVLGREQVLERLRSAAGSE